ncbi:U32 family peptidase [Elusimicrobiota bacterium]
MKLSVSTNFSDDFLQAVCKYDPVKEVYGKLSEDFFGGGRPSAMLPHVSKKRLKRFIREAHSAGIKFNYLLNTTCMNNQEITKQGYKRIRRFLDWLSYIGTDSVTVAMPYIARIVKRHYPHLKLKVSAFAGVSDLHHARSWDEIGADTITLKPQILNRDFSTIADIAAKCRAEVQLIVNQACLFACPNVEKHSNLISHASQKNHYLGGFVIDYYVLECKYRKLADKANFIKSTWIRPEDLSVYESYGVKDFKIIQRNWTTEKLENIVRSYTQRKYDGNLADLEEFLFGENTFLSGWRKLKYFFRPFRTDLRRLACMYRNIRSINCDVYIDNRKLDGFINEFVEKNCLGRLCSECGYCNDIAQKAVSINGNTNIDRLKENLDWFLDRTDI